LEVCIHMFTGSLVCIHMFTGSLVCIHMFRGSLHLFRGAFLLFLVWSLCFDRLVTFLCLSLVLVMSCASLFFFLLTLFL
jgi:hypothetical protein